jgi:dihydroorotate dehydrogenase
MGLVWEKIVRPAMFGLDAERAHELGMKALKLGLVRGERSFPEFGMFERFGLTFENPLGIAAGFDKNGIAVNELAALGFGFVEVGTVTFRPQKGNEKPRLFRLPDDDALINRLGFNNDGADAVAERLGKLKRKRVVGVNIGKNKDVPNEEAVENYLACFDVVHPVADYVAVNVSSPNTPTLRDLQQTESLEELLSALQARNSDLGPKPLLVKIAPDLSEVEIEAIVDICVSHEISGIIATNTTVSRSGLNTKEPERFGEGGLSGKPLAARANEVIKTTYRRSKGKLPVIGVGGILTAEDAFEKIAAGACLLQVYTGFIYGGPRFPKEINTDLAAMLKSKGFSSLDEAVGSGISAV